MTVACACTRPLPHHQTLCDVCAEGFRTNLTRTPGVIRDLGTTVARMDRIGPRSLGSSGHRVPPLPVNLAAVDVRHRLITALAGIYQGTMHVPQGLAVVDPRGQVASILRRFDRVATMPAAPAWHAALVEALKAAAVAVDHPADLIYTGTCGGLEDCVNELWAVPAQTVITCRMCGTSWDVNDRRARALAAIEDMILTGEHVTRALASYGLSISRGNLTYWRQQGYLGFLTVAGVMRYRVGDVVEVAGRMRELRANSRRSRRLEKV